MSLKKTPKQSKFDKLEEEKEIKKRFYFRNVEAQRFCNKHGLTIYAASQAGNTGFVRVFVQKGVHFKPLNDILYNQEDPNDVMTYVAAIDDEYERLYLKMKDKV